ncbi:MAG: outer membrane protein transport protein [Candidatus Aminicenantes bacterium]|nr:outer membrane protein transport protein [Candidatus Aminicenantes bacterium]
MLKKICGLILFIMLTSSQNLKATGYSIYELGARAAALAGAFVARADDTSAIYFNPAGIAFLDGLRIKTNVQFSPMKTTAFSPGTDFVFTSAPLQIQGLHYVTWSPFNKLTFGFGMFSPYSTETEWGSGWPGNSFSITSRLISNYYRPSVAIELTEGLALGFGIDFVFSRIEWSRNIEFPAEKFIQTSNRYFAESRPKAEGRGLGFVAGILWKISKRLQIGGRYQHQVVIDAKGENTFHDAFLGGSSVFILGPDNRTIEIHKLMDRYYEYQHVSIQLLYPTEIVLGLMYVPVDRLTLLLDFHWSEWSKAKNWEFISDKSGADMSPEFMEDFGNFFGVIPDYDKQSAEMKWKDTWKIKFGVEYALSPVFALRAGYAFNQSAMDGKVIHPVNPDLDQNIISFGLGYEGPLLSLWDDKKMCDFTFDFFVQYMFSKTLTSSFPGFGFSYDTDRFAVGIGIGFDFE